MFLTLALGLGLPYFALGLFTGMPPTVVFLDGQGRERRDLRFGSFVRAPEMLRRIRAVAAGGR